MENIITLVCFQENLICVIIYSSDIEFEGGSMRNSCRQVECPECGHLFMLINGWWTSSCTQYVDKNTGEKYSDAICPSCGIHMAVIPNVLKGLCEDSSFIDRHDGRPI